MTARNYCTKCNQYYSTPICSVHGSADMQLRNIVGERVVNIIPSYNERLANTQHQLQPVPSPVQTGLSVSSRSQQPTSIGESLIGFGVLFGGIVLYDFIHSLGLGGVILVGLVVCAAFWLLLYKVGWPFYAKERPKLSIAIAAILVLGLASIALMIAENHASNSSNISSISVPNARDASSVTPSSKNAAKRANINDTTETRKSEESDNADESGGTPAPQSKESGDVPSSGPSSVEQQNNNQTSSARTNMWYYCGSAHMFYPYVQRCAVPWRAVKPYKVVPLQ